MTLKFAMVGAMVTFGSVCSIRNVMFCFKMRWNAMFKRCFCYILKRVLQSNLSTRPRRPPPRFRCYFSQLFLYFALRKCKNDRKIHIIIGELFSIISIALKPRMNQGRSMAPVIWSRVFETAPPPAAMRKLY